MVLESEVWFFWVVRVEVWEGAIARTSPAMLPSGTHADRRAFLWSLWSLKMRCFLLEIYPFHPAAVGAVTPQDLSSRCAYRSWPTCRLAAMMSNIPSDKPQRKPTILFSLKSLQVLEIGCEWWVLHVGRKRPPLSITQCLRTSQPNLIFTPYYLLLTACIKFVKILNMFTFKTHLFQHRWM